MSSADGKYINLHADDRFVPTEALRAAYLRYDDTRSPNALPYVRLINDFELGIVSSEPPQIARAVSSILSRSLEDAKDGHGGHLPRAVVERVQLEIISPQRVASLWGPFGHRFVLSRPDKAGRSEIVGTILVARRKGTFFFFTGRYNNVRHSQMEHDIDWNQPVADDPAHKWFDLFAFPDPPSFKPVGYHHIANFVVAKEHRRQGLARFFLDAILSKYCRDHIDKNGAPVEHSQFLLCGKGFWQIGDPPWLERMQRLGFSLRWGAESFFIEHDWAPLPPIYAGDRQISNTEYNESFDMPGRYLREKPPAEFGMHLHGRVPEVIRLSRDPRAKLQYFQVYLNFV